MTGMYLAIRNDAEQVWNTGWTHADVPVFWRSDDLQPLPDPTTAPHYFRNEVDFGLELLLSFGGGRGRNLKCQYGSVIMRCFTSRVLGDEDVALELLNDATTLYRSLRMTDGLGNDLSFIGNGSGFDWGPTENGNWFMRGCLAVFEYRFRG